MNNVDCFSAVVFAQCAHEFRWYILPTSREAFTGDSPGAMFNSFLEIFSPDSLTGLYTLGDEFIPEGSSHSVKLFAITINHGVLSYEGCVVREVDCFEVEEDEIVLEIINRVIEEPGLLVPRAAR